MLELIASIFTFASAAILSKQLIAEGAKSIAVTSKFFFANITAS